MVQITRREFAATAAALSAASAAPARARTVTQYDFVVAGAGHNSLMTACYLQKAGFNCLVLEGRPTVGGGVKTAELTLEGFHHDVCSTFHLFIQQNPALRENELRLGDYGLEYIIPDPVFHHAFPDGSYITRWRDFDRSCDEIAKYSKRDAETFRRTSGQIEDLYARTGSPGADMFAPPGWTKGFESRLHEQPDARLWRVRKSMSKWDALHRLYEDERVIAMMLAPFPTSSHANSSTAPNNGLDVYPRRNRIGPVPKGGSGMLSVALQRCFEAAGGIVLVNAPVAELIVENGRCAGVVCADGTAHRASKAVVSTIHVKRLIEMAPKALWPAEFLEGVDVLHTGDAAFNVLYATTAPCIFSTKEGGVAPVHVGNLSSPRRALQFEAELAAREFSWEDPVLQIVQASVVDPSRAPQEGWQTLRILCEQAVYDPVNIGNARMTPREKWESVKDVVAKAHLRALQKLAPNLTDDKVLAKSVITPPEIEQMNASMYQGSCHGYVDNPFQWAADRPAPGWGGYRMPIPGLYQTGTCTHPGGSVSGGSGRAAAMVLLKDFGGLTIADALRRT